MLRFVESNGGMVHIKKRYDEDDTPRDNIITESSQPKNEEYTLPQPTNRTSLKVNTQRKSTNDILSKIDKKKLWLLDSTAFDKVIEDMKNKVIEPSSTESKDTK